MFNVHMFSRVECVVCGTALAGRQRRFCSRACKNRETNNRHQNYVAQQQRGRRRKLALMRERGMRCERCGYHANHAALSWHHVDPSMKSFDLDLRALSNRSEAAVAAEASKCRLYCLNCHAEVHFPHCK